MDQDDYRRWASHVEELTDMQRSDMRARLSNGHDVVRSHNDWLFEGICDSLKAHGLLSASSRYLLMQGRAYKTYAKHAHRLQSELEKLLRDNPSRHARTVLAGLCGDCLIAWCKYRVGTVSAKVVLINAVHIIEALNNAFPGYMASGMFHVALSGKIGNGR